jgi:hypothetical protein
MLIRHPADRPVELEGLATELADVDTDTAPNPLTVDVEQRDGDYRVSYRFAADRFDHDAVTDLATHVHAVLRAITTDPGRTLAELRSVTTAKRS